MGKKSDGRKPAGRQADAKPKAGKGKNVADASANGKLKGKEYEQQLREAARRTREAAGMGPPQGAKICIVFEGRDGAGKGGMIKAITERVSPRVFRVIALPAPTEREKSQMYVQRYLPHLPAAGEM